MTYERLREVNGEMKLTPIKGKDYAQVNQRVKAFRMLYPEGTIETDIEKIEEGFVVIKATVRDDMGKPLATGISYEREGSSMINKTSFIENCETSAVGRALGFLGLGIDTSICSAEELTVALDKQGKKNVIHCEKCGGEITSVVGKDGRYIPPQEVAEIAKNTSGQVLCADCLKGSKTNV